MHSIPGQPPLWIWLPRLPRVVDAPLPRSLRFYLLAGLANPGQEVLTPPQFIPQITAAVALAVAPILLGIKDLGLTHQGVDLLLQLFFGFEHALVAHGLVLAGIGLHLGAVQRPMAQAHHARLLAEPQDLNEQVAQRVEVAAASH